MRKNVCLCREREREREKPFRREKSYEMICLFDFIVIFFCN
jgi:hypothetical protein